MAEYYGGTWKIGAGVGMSGQNLFKWDQVLSVQLVERTVLIWSKEYKDEKPSLHAHLMLPCSDAVGGRFRWHCPHEIPTVKLLFVSGVGEEGSLSVFLPSSLKVPTANRCASRTIQRQVLLATVDEVGRQYIILATLQVCWVSFFALL